MNFMSYISSGLLIVILGLGVKIDMLKSDYDNLIVEHVKEISILNNKLDVEKAKNAVSVANEVIYESTIDDLNKQIDKYKLNTNRKNNELEIYKNLPDGVKYKKLYDTLNSIKDSVNDCERYEDTSIAFDDFDLNSL